ncbi:VCBS domain-containing protein [Aeromonas veronii]|uniref:VCBS domain-containing protein n=1 Tax=Aeromonas veronii TaxID=654 RepID=UPI0034186164
MTFTITGANDGAVIGGAFTGAVTEDQAVQSGQLQASGQLTITDADSGEDHFIPQTDVLGSYGLGRFSLDAQGHWSYSADNSQKAIQQLGVGATLTDSFTVQAADGTQHTVMVTLTGSNDAPQFHLQVAPEYHPELESGDVLPLVINNIGFSRVAQYLDIQQILQGQAPIGAYVNTCVTVSLGGLALIGPDGQAAQVFAPGQEFKLQTLVDWQQQGPGHEFRVFGPKGTTGLDLSFHDAGDPNHITGPQGQASLYVNQVHIWPPFHAWQASTGAATDSGLLTATEGGAALSGQFHASDIDVGDTLSYSLGHPVDGFTLNADGSYSFDPGNAAYHHLTAGQTQTLTIPITVTDSAGGTSTQNLSLILTGANDGAVIGGVMTGATQEDRPDALSGQLTVADADDGEAHFIAQSGTAGSYGQFSLDENGQWHYQIDNSKPEVQALRDGQNVTDSFTVASADGSQQQVTVTITGKNDAAVITGDDQRMVTEDQAVDGYGNLHVTGQLHADDPDGNAGILQFQQQNAVQASYGRFTLNADGYWLYEADNKNPAIQQLKSSESLTDTLTAHSADGTPHTITVTIQGQDDAAAFVPQAQAAQISSSDVYTTIGVQLLSSEHREFQFMAEVLLGNTDPRSYATAEMSFTNTGVALRAPDGSLASVYHAVGGMTTVPLIELRNWHNKGQGYDVVLVDATGMPVNVFPHDASDPDKMSGFNQYVSGFSGPSNAAAVLYPDAPAAIAPTAGSLSAAHVALPFDTAHVQEDNDQQIMGLIQVHDPDQGQSSMQAMTNHQAAHGRFNIDVNGNWTYQLDSSRSDVQALKDGQTLIDTITVHSADGTPHAVNITIHGQNDGAVISGADTGQLVEDQNVSAAGSIETQGQLLLADADAGEAVFVAQANAAGSYGVFSFDEDGHWRYSVDSSQAAIQQLKAGATLSDSFTVHSVDGTAHTVSVTITGSNDAPVLTTQSQALDGGGALYQGHMSATDADVGDALSFSTTATVAGFTLHADGSYQFDPSGAAYQHLTSGQSQNVVIPITVTDSAGATSTQNLTLTVTSAAHGAVISGVTSGSLSEDGSSAVASGQLSIVDPDAGEAHFIAQANVSAQHGHFSLQDNGAWTYTLDNKDAAVQALKAGESFSEHLTVKSVDGTTHVLTVTVQGSNDAPVLQAQSQSVTEDGSQLHGKMVAQDADHGDALRFSTPNAVGGFTLNADGSYSFDPSHHDYQSLGAGQTRDIAIPITVTDSAGATATQMLNVHITGRDDRTSIYGVDSGSVQAGVHPEASGDLHASDDDAGQSGFRAGTVNGSFGRLSIDAQGHWSYRVDESDPFVMHLLPNSHFTEQVTVHSVDDTAHDIEIEVSGAPGGGQLSAPADSVTVQHVALPQVWDAYQAQTGGHELFAGILAAVRAGGYQYQGLADELEKGNLATFANLDLSIAGARVQVIDAAGNLVQRFTPTAENAATLHMSDVLFWHAQGHHIVVASDSGQDVDTARMWLHNTGDMHSIQVMLPNGNGFTAWSDQWTFGELSLNVMPAPVPVVASDEQSVDLTDMPPSQSDQVNIEVTPVAEHDAPQQLIPILADMTASDGDSKGVDINDEQPMSIASHVVDYWQFADLSDVAQRDKSDGHPFADQVSGYLDAAGIHVEGGAQVMPPMPPVEALIDDHVNGINDEHHMAPQDEPITGNETAESLPAPEDPSHQHHG